MTNNNLYNQFQQDVVGVANNMMTQLVCAEKGINYGTLMQTAQQMHIQGIVQQEQTRAMEQAISRHYQGNQPQGIIGRIKEAIAPQPASNAFMNPFMPAMPSMPMTVNPVMPALPNPVAANPVAPNFNQSCPPNYSFPTPQQMGNQLVPPQPVQMPEVPVGNEMDRMSQLENEMTQLKEMILNLGQVMQQQPE